MVGQTISHYKILDRLGHSDFELGETYETTD